VADDEVHHFSIAPLAASQIRGAPIVVSITARDVNGATITNYAGAVSLHAVTNAGPLLIASYLFSERPQTFSDVLQQPAEVFDSFCNPPFNAPV
jgi:hypothetical protein